MASNNLTKVIFFDNKSIDFNKSTDTNGNVQGNLNSSEGSFYSNGIYFSPPADNTEGHIMHGGKVYTLGPKLVIDDKGSKELVTKTQNSNAILKVTDGVNFNVYSNFLFDRIQKSISADLYHYSLNTLISTINDLANRINNIENNVEKISTDSIFTAVTNINYDGSAKVLIKLIEGKTLNSSITYKYRIGTSGDFNTFTNVSAITATNADSYTVYIRMYLNGASLKEWADRSLVQRDEDGIEYIKLEAIQVTINKANITINYPTFSSKNIPVGGGLVALFNEDELSRITTSPTATVKISYNNTDYTLEDAKSIKVNTVDTYKFKIKATTPNTNYKDTTTSELSIVVEQAEADKQYYYYAGWEYPSNEEELVRLAVAPNGAYIGTTLGTYTKSNPLRYFNVTDGIEQDNIEQYYVVVPNGISLYDSEGESSLTDMFETNVDTTTIPNHKIYKTIPAYNADLIAGIMLR